MILFNDITSNTGSVSSLYLSSVIFFVLNFSQRQRIRQQVKPTYSHII